MRRKFDQIFLKDRNILRKIVESANIKEGEKIIEIGPGKGFLTSYLLSRGAEVYAIEIDKNMIEFLKRNLSHPRLKLINEDFLKLDFDKYFKGERLKLVANIPYSITGKILRRLMEIKNFFTKFILLYKKKLL